MSLPIALQLYTVRDVLEKDLDAGLAQVAEIGFKHVEMAGLYDRTATDVKALLDKHGLTPLGGHVMYANEPDSLEPAVADARTLGFGFLAQPWWPEDRRSVQGYRQIITAAREATARHPDFRFGYHNHEFEFETIDGDRTAFEVLFFDTDLLAQMDVAWACVGGHDPLALLDRLAGRVPALHMKDATYRSGDAKLVEAGTGEVPLDAIAKVAADKGVEYLVVEQDNNWIDNDPIKSAQISLDYLNSINP
jgi:sugar phosphate isomerase/epimerase